MLKKPAPKQTAFEMVTFDSPVPEDYLLRKIYTVIDFSFVHDRVSDRYCIDNDRSPHDPTLMCKALLIGHLFVFARSRIRCARLSSMSPVADFALEAVPRRLIRRRPAQSAG